MSDPAIAVVEFDSIAAGIFTGEPGLGQCRCHVIAGRVALMQSGSRFRPVQPRERAAYPLPAAWNWTAPPLPATP